ncbi:MAG: ion transporter [Bacteroidetes bacterium RIFCSPLOWO2_12_FULL_31_6]|nr:MAG: ion transporter [Bacteroidetes bacterium RIFCSPLOWO2_12_FULL_31_6]
MINSGNKDDDLGFLNLLIIVLSIYVLASLVIETFFQLPVEISKVLDYIDNIICGIFLFDFIVRFKRAESKLKFMKWGWIDLIASIPTLDIMRAGRLIRLFRLIRILRAFRSTRLIAQHIFRNKVKGTLTTVSLLAILTLLFSAIAILQVETVENSNIKTAEDAIWWAYVTITTVGYGDKFPVTTEGRIIASILMTVGVGLFGTFTAYIASLFVKDSNGEDNTS